MRKKIEHSNFIEDGIRYMQCKMCLSEYVEVGDDIAAVTCSRCTTIIMLKEFPDNLPTYKQITGKTPGWHWMKEFVDKDGNVYHKGIEQPDLKGTLSPTKVKPRKKRKKKSATERMFDLAKKYKKKQKAKRKK